MKALPGLLALGFLLLINPNSQAQTVRGSYTSFGRSCNPYGYSNYSIYLRLSNCPGLSWIRIGRAYYVIVTWPSVPNPPKTPFMFFFTGVSSKKWGNLPLPLNIPWFSLPPFGITYGPCLQVSPDVVSFPRDIWNPKNGVCKNVFKFGIPNDPSLVGIAFYQQAMGFIPEQWKWTTWWSRPAKAIIGNN